ADLQHADENAAAAGDVLERRLGEVGQVDAVLLPGTDGNRLHRYNSRSRLESRKFGGIPLIVAGGFGRCEGRIEALRVKQVQLDALAGPSAGPNGCNFCGPAASLFRLVQSTRTNVKIIVRLGRLRGAEPGSALR